MTMNGHLILVNFYGLNGHHSIKTDDGWWWVKVDCEWVVELLPA